MLNVVESSERSNAMANAVEKGQQLLATEMTRIRRLPETDPSWGIFIQHYNSCGSSYALYPVSTRLLKEACENGDLINGESTLILHIDTSASNDTSMLAMSITREAMKQNIRIVVVVKNDVFKLTSLLFHTLGAKVVRGGPHESLTSSAQRFQNRLPNSYFMNIKEHLKRMDHSMLLDDMKWSSQVTDEPDLLMTTKDMSLEICNYEQINLNTCITACVNAEPPVDYESNGGESLIYFKGPAVHAVIEELNNIDLLQKESYDMSRKMVRHEGLMCTCLGGALVALAFKAVDIMKKRSNKNSGKVIVMIPDALNIWISECNLHLNEYWMLEKGFCTAEEMEERTWYSSIRLGSLCLSTHNAIQASFSVIKTVDILKTDGNDRMLVLDDKCIIGIVTRSLCHSLTKGLLTGNELLRDIKLEGLGLYRKFKNLSVESTVANLEEILKEAYFVIVTASVCETIADEAEIKADHEAVIGIATQSDVFEWISAMEEHHRWTSNWDITNNRPYSP